MMMMMMMITPDQEKITIQDYNNSRLSYHKYHCSYLFLVRPALIAELSVRLYYFVLTMIFLKQ